MRRWFSTPQFQGLWFTHHHSRTSIRETIQIHLNEALADPTGTLTVDQRGPHWSGEKNLHLSYSHSGEWTLLLYSQEHELGVDFESIARRTHTDPLKIAWRYFHPNEVAALRQLETDEVGKLQLFLELWTKKEAYGKLTREGLRGSIHLDINTLPDVSFQSIPIRPNEFIATSALWKSKSEGG